MFGSHNKEENKVPELIVEKNYLINHDDGDSNHIAEIKVLKISPSKEYIKFDMVYPELEENESGIYWEEYSEIEIIEQLD